MNTAIFKDIIERAFSNLSDQEITAFLEPFGLEEDNRDLDHLVEQLLNTAISQSPDNTSATTQSFIDELNSKGFVVIENILTDDEVIEAKRLFFEWFDQIVDFYALHKKINPHYIFKFHEVGHQLFAWYIRCNHNIQNIFKQIWKTDDLIVSFDGACYFKQDTKTTSKSKSSIWTHTDQAPKQHGRVCVQGFVSLTDNTNNTLVVYEGSHNLFENYFKTRDMENISSRWNKIDPSYLDEIQDRKRVLRVPKGSLVLWDSRVFHQNQITDESEERLVQYVCYLPRNSTENTKANQNKRLLYFNDRRTTSHWPCPVKVNGKQPQTYGDESLLIDYNSLPKPDLTNLISEINKIL